MLDPPSSVTKAVILSAPLPLDVGVFAWTNTSVSGNVGVERMLNPSIIDICEVSERWKYTELHVNWRSLQDLQVLEHREAPHLEILKLRVQARRNIEPLPELGLFGGGSSANRLQILHLAGVKTPLSLLQNLHDLELDDAWLSESELLSVVKTNSSLCRLVLPGVTSPPTQPAWPARSSIRLSKLEHVVFGDKGKSPATRLLPYILLPRLRDLSVTLGYQPATGALSSAAKATLDYMAMHVQSPAIKTISLLCG